MAESLRAALRSGTEDLHARLDAVVGTFEAHCAYRHYLVQSYRFRSAVEPMVAGRAEWQVEELAPLIRCDLDDLGVGAVSVPAAPVLDTGFSALLGASYVLEGSAIGARVLFRRARQLGMSPQHGARHLASQSRDARRWAGFLAFMETGQPDHRAVLDGARAVFHLALECYSEPVDERV